MKWNKPVDRFQHDSNLPQSERQPVGIHEYFEDIIKMFNSVKVLKNCLKCNINTFLLVLLC